MAKVGFAGLQGHLKGALERLDARADKAAERIDQVEGRGHGGFDKLDRHIDGVENVIDGIEKQVAAGDNGGPDGPLPGSGTTSATGNPQ